jgi:hypothetical protein
VQIGGDHRGAAQIRRLGHRPVVRRGFLVDAEQDRLQGGVPGLDQVAGVPVGAGARRIGG